MNKVYRILAVGLLAISGLALHAQTGTLPVATPTSATIPFTLGSNCTTTQTCQVQVYRNTGTCPATLAGSTGWTLLATTAAQATSYTDNTVVGGTQYSYDVEAVPTGSTTVFSGPSNCVSATIPFTPVAPVIGIITTL